MKLLPIFVLILLVTAGCSQTSPEPTGYDLELFEAGQQKSMARTGDKTSIKVLKIEDSRCPSNAICIWYGYAKAVVEVSLDGRIFTDTLYTPEYSSLNFFSSKDFQSGAQKISVTLKNVTPYPCSGCEKTEPAVAHIETQKKN